MKKSEKKKIIAGALALLKAEYEQWIKAVEIRDAIPHRALTADEFYDQWRIASHDANNHWYCWTGIGSLMRSLLPSWLGLKYSEIIKIAKQIQKEWEK